MGAHYRTPAPAVQEQILPQHVLRTDAGGLSGHGQDGGVGILAAEQGDGVHVGLIFHAVVGAAVHVDGHAGDHQQVAVDIHQLLRDDAVLPDEETARCGQGTVEPCGHQHAAVLLGIQAHIAVVAQLRVLLELEGGGVAVGGGHHEAAGKALRYTEGDEAGAVAGNEIPAAGGQRPALSLGQRDIARRRQLCCGVGDDMVAAGAAGNEVQQGPDRVLCHRENLLCPRKMDSFAVRHYSTRDADMASIVSPAAKDACQPARYPL